MRAFEKPLRLRKWEESLPSHTACAAVDMLRRRGGTTIVACLVGQLLEYPSMYVRFLFVWSCALQERIKEAIEKIRLNKQLPYLVGSVVEVRVLVQCTAEQHHARNC